MSNADIKSLERSDKPSPNEVWEVLLPREGPDGCEPAFCSLLGTSGLVNAAEFGCALVVLSASMTGGPSTSSSLLIPESVDFEALPWGERLALPLVLGWRSKSKGERFLDFCSSVLPLQLL